MEAAHGMAKIVSAQDDDEILGVHVIGPMAGELIAEAVLAMEYSASTEDVQRARVHIDSISRRQGRTQGTPPRLTPLTSGKVINASEMIRAP
jgi:Pyridine nucleotide-disulphide oxidoreductase, dimerisation domain